MKVGWKSIGMICSNVFAGGTPSTKHDEYYDGKIPWIRSGEIDFNVITRAERNITELGLTNSSAKKIRKNSVVMAMTGATVAKTAVISIETTANQSVCALETNEEIVNFKYLYYCLAKDYFRIKSSAQGALTSLNLAMIKDIVIPVPSLSEQSRIVSMLDTFTSSIENLKEQIAQRRKQYEYYRDQLLDLEGKEGVEMKKLLDVLAQPITDGPHETPSFYDDGIPFISADAIVDNKINFSRKRGFISEEYDLLCQKKYKPQLNDIYLVKSGSTTGKVAIVRTEERFNIWSPLAAIRVNQSNHPYFVYYLLQTKKVQDQVKLKSSQGSQPNLSMRIIEKFVIPVPSLSEQQRIVSILDTFESSISNLEGQLAERQKQYEYYRNKLLTFE